MRKINLLLPFLLTIILILSSCKNSGSNTTPTGNTEASKPSLINTGSILDKNNWQAIPNVVTNYVKLDDINPGGVPEIKSGFNIDIVGSIVKETNDGFLCGYTAIPEVSFVSKHTRNTPKIIKLDKSGVVVWQKNYDYLTYSGKLNNLLILSDGSFIFSVQTYPYYKDNNLIMEKSFIVKCYKDGTELWKRDFDDYSGGLLQNLFITENGEIMAVGRGQFKDGSQTKDVAVDDIVVTKLSNDGNLLKQKSFGGSDFDYPNTAKYDEELGIIINGRTQSNDGNFAIAKDKKNVGFIARIDESLDLKWVSHSNDRENFIHDQLAVSNGFVYVLGNFSGGSGTPVNGFLTKLDKDGKRIWTKSNLCTGLWGCSLSILENGDIIVGAGRQNKGEIVILDKGDNPKKSIENLKYSPNMITHTDDKGFIITSVRDIKSVPQPPFISSIWYDTELVAVKYKSDCTIEWQKTYDRYKDKKGPDYVFPFKNGKLLVETIN